VATDRALCGGSHCYPAKLIWLEALDGGDPLKKVPHRDKLMSLGAPFAEALWKS